MDHRQATRTSKTDSPEEKLLKLIHALESTGDHDVARRIEGSAMQIAIKYQRRPRLIQDLALHCYLRTLYEAACEAGCTPIIEAFTQLDPPKSSPLFTQRGSLQ